MELDPRQSCIRRRPEQHFHAFHDRSRGGIIGGDNFYFHQYGHDIYFTSGVAMLLQKHSTIS
jgi:hypothetical protein